MIRTGLRALVALGLAAGGAGLIFAAGWFVAVEIVPEVASSGWSLQGSSQVLNRQWAGNELYLLVALYFGSGAALVVGGLRAWPRRELSSDLR